MKKGLVLLLLFIVASAYMRLGLFIPIQWTDEGVIVYPIWRVAEGDLPYRDFQHLYGPSVFFLNGLLMRVFGHELAVVRYSLLVVKAISCVLVYVAACRMSGRIFAAISYAIAVVIAGLVWPISTTPYPSFYGTGLCLAGLLCFLAMERRFLLACAMAGLCFGVATTFKQTMGAFAFLSLALYLLVEKEKGWENRLGAPPALLVRTSRWFVLVFTLGLSVFYLAPGNPPWNLALLLTPVLVLTGKLALRELRGEGDQESHVRSFWGMVALSLAFLAPLTGYALMYVSLGLGSEILFNTVSGIPSASDWIVPYPIPTRLLLIWQLGCLGGFASAAIWRRRSGAARRDWRAYAMVLLLAPTLWAMATLAVGGWGARHWSWWFHGSTSNLLFSMPFVLVGLALVAAARLEQVSVGESSSSQRRTFFLFTCYATMSLLWLYPAADIWHVLALIPSCLPLLAWQLDRFWRMPTAMTREQSSQWAWRPVAGTLICALTLVLVLPPVHDLMLERRVEPAFPKSLPRATGVHGDSSRMTMNGGRLVRYLIQNEQRDKPLYVLSNKQLFYFLTDRVSPVQEFEFIQYMVGIDAIREDRAREIFDEVEVIRRLRELHPLIVDDSYDRASRNIRMMYPRLAQFIGKHYRVGTKFGRFRVLEWDSSRTRP